MPKIFLSHTFSDKPVVEPVALALKETFGERNVFYDERRLHGTDRLFFVRDKGPVHEQHQVPETTGYAHFSPNWRHCHLLAFPGQFGFEAGPLHVVHPRRRG